MNDHNQRFYIEDTQVEQINHLIPHKYSEHLTPGFINSNPLL